MSIKDLDSEQQKQLLLGSNLYNDCKQGNYNAITLKKLRSRTCVVNREMNQNLSTSDLLTLCGLDASAHNIPDLCCFCNDSRSKQQVYKVKPCNHTVHAQCVRRIHEYRTRRLLDTSQAYRYPTSLVVCPICFHPIHASVEELYSLTTMPHEFVKRFRDDGEDSQAKKHRMQPPKVDDDNSELSDDNMMEF